MKRIFCMFSIALCLCLSCKTDKRTQVAKYIQEWQQKEIQFPRDLPAKSLGIDTSLDYKKGRLKILIYADSAGCTSCRLGIPELKKMIDTCRIESRDVNFIIVVQTNNYKEFEHQLSLHGFTYPIVCDPKGEFDKLNNFPEEAEFRTFLLDENNRVVMIGSPVHNKAIRELYMKLIRQ